MPKRIVFEVGVLGIDGKVQSRERVPAELKTWPETSADVEWPRIQKKLQEVRKKRGWHCRVKFHNGTELEDLCDPRSLRRLLEVQKETMLQERVELPLYLFSDPTSGTSEPGKDEKEIVFETEEQGNSIQRNLESDLQLGEGGFGTVLRATHGEDHIALKVAIPDPRSVESMKKEICILLQLDHPNITKVLQQGYVVDPINGRLPAYMMDLGRCSVDALLETGWHTKAAAEAARRDVGSALQHFHSAGLGHMDVKPGNWLVTNKCTAATGETQLTLTLIDAGGAGRLKEDYVRSFARKYSHPMQRGEDWRMSRVEAFFDWYSLKASIFQLCSCSEDGIPKDEKVFAKASEALAEDKEFILQAVLEDGFALAFASERPRCNKEVVMEAVRQNGWALRFASETFHSDKEVVMEAVRQNGFVLEFASETLRSDKEVVIEAVREDGSALEFASETLRSDKEVVMEAVRQVGFALEFASETLQSDKVVVMEAVRQNGSALRFASETLRSDKEVVMEAVSQDDFALRYAMKYASETRQSDKEVVMEEVREEGCALEFASKIFRSDKEVVMEAVRHGALEFASKTFWGDKEVVMEAVRQYGLALEYASETLRSDKEVVMEAVRQNGRALRFASETLRSDKEVVMEAVSQDDFALRYAMKYASETRQSACAIL